MREQDIRRILQDVCDTLDRKAAKAGVVAVSVAMSVALGCSGNATFVVSDATTTTTTTTSDAGTTDSPPTTDSGAIDTTPGMAYMAQFTDSAPVATDSQRIIDDPEVSYAAPDTEIAETVDATDGDAAADSAPDALKIDVGPIMSYMVQFADTGVGEQ
jgi:hypothetical protein